MYRGGDKTLIVIPSNWWRVGQICWSFNESPILVAVTIVKMNCLNFTGIYIVFDSVDVSSSGRHVWKEADAKICTAMLLPSGEKSAILCVLGDLCWEAMVEMILMSRGLYTADTVIYTYNTCFLKSIEYLCIVTNFDSDQWNKILAPALRIRWLRVQWQENFHEEFYRAQICMKV